MPEQDETRSLQAGAWVQPAVSATERRAEESLLAALARADYLSLAAVLGLVLLVYAQLWLPGLVLIKRDAFQLFLPLKQYIFDRLSQGELPQWFPYEGLGRPLISLTVMGVFHPFTLLYWLLPVQDAYRLATLLCCLMGAAGTFFLARSLGISRSGAAIGSIGFSCSGYVMSLTENLLYLYSTCALPLFLYALERTCRTGRKTWLVWAGLVWASIILNGDIQTAYYVGFVALHLDDYAGGRDAASRTRTRTAGRCGKPHSTGRRHSACACLGGISAQRSGRCIFLSCGSHPLVDASAAICHAIGVADRRHQPRRSDCSGPLSHTGTGARAVRPLGGKPVSRADPDRSGRGCLLAAS